jgi:predicted negative regulator of RcsB-dependent stress response
MRGEEPDSAVTANQLAATLLKLQRPAEARTLIEAVLDDEKRPGVRSFLLMNLGKALAAEGDSIAARARWDEAVQLNPSIREKIAAP